MSNLSDELINGITRVKKELYPIMEKSEGLNESALLGRNLLVKAYECLDQAAEVINARGFKGGPA